MPEVPSLPTLLDVSRRIAQLKRIRLHRVDVEHLIGQIKPLMHGHALGTAIFDVGRIFYRGRRMHDLPTGLLDTRPPFTGASPGRLNRQNRAILYTNLAAGSVFREIRVQPGETIALFCFRAKRQITTASAGFDVDALLAKGWGRHLPDWCYRPEGLTARKVNRLVNSFVANEFVKDVRNDHDYKLSIAWSEALLEVKEFDGITYPSVANNGISDNVALRPELLGDSLELVRIDFLRVDELIGNLTKFTPLYRTEGPITLEPFRFRPASEWKRLDRSKMSDDISFQLEGFQWTITAPNGEIIGREDSY